MTNNNKHQILAPVFSLQSHSNNDQNLQTFGIVHEVPRTNGKHPARQTRIITLNAGGVSRDSARLPAGPTGEWPDHPTHTVSSVTTNNGNRPDSAPTRPHALLNQTQLQPRTSARPRSCISAPSIRAPVALTSLARTPGPIHMHPDAPAGEST